MNSVWLVAAAVAGAALAMRGGSLALQRTLRSARDDHSKRPAMWNRFYDLDLGDTSTNNYGFAPAEGGEPQRFQHQMYRELLRLLKQRQGIDAGMQLLEVSCGRGGGLNAFVSAEPGKFDATGLDVAASAIAFCRSTYGEKTLVLSWVARSVPFPTEFDVVLNVRRPKIMATARVFAEVAGDAARWGVRLHDSSGGRVAK